MPEEYDASYFINESILFAPQAELRPSVSWAIDQLASIWPKERPSLQ